MGFIVTRPGGTPDGHHLGYLRALRKSWVALGRVPRVPDPERPSRWAAVWASLPEAEQFIEELGIWCEAEGWRVESTDLAPTVGPFGPLTVFVEPTSEGLSSHVPLLASILAREAVPDAAPWLTRALIGSGEWDDFAGRGGEAASWIAKVAPALSGLTPDQLESLGYVAVDRDGRTWVEVPPQNVGLAHASTPPAADAPAMGFSTLSPG